MNETQREALSVLAEIWDLSPDVRLGQLMAHLGFLGEAHVSKGLGYIEDDELIAVLYRHRAELMDRLEDAPNQLPDRSATASAVGGAKSPKAASPDAPRS